jgi:hypothetical protein
MAIAEGKWTALAVPLAVETPGRVPEARSYDASLAGYPTGKLPAGLRKADLNALEHPVTEPGL